MLCITIKEGQQFFIGETVLFVKKYSSNSYRVYIQADKSLKISRGEDLALSTIQFKHLPLDQQNELINKIRESYKKNASLSKTQTEAEKATAKELNVSLALITEHAKVKSQLIGKNFFKK